MINAKSLPALLLAITKASNDMKNITANIFKEIPDKYITLFVDSLGRLVACNQELSSMKHEGDYWVFRGVDGLDLAIIGKGYDSIGWRKSAIARPCGVKGARFRTRNKPIFVPTTPKGGLYF